MVVERESMNLPPFDANGMLPPGDYPMTLDDLTKCYLVTGGSNFPTCDCEWRRMLVDNLKILVGQLWSIGIDSIFVDGSFAEDKDHPNDIDGYFVCDLMRFVNGDIERELNMLDPHKVWTWHPNSRHAYAGQAKKQLPMWHRYRVELYPHLPPPMNRTGIRDEFGNDLEFPSAFRRSRRDGLRKGIIEIIK
jgi:hypothetical protein